MDNKYPQNPNENQQPQNNEEKSNKVMKRLFQLIVILLLIIIIILLLLRSCGDGWQKPTEPTKPQGGVIFDPNAGDYTDPTATQRPNITVPGWPKIVIPCDQLEIPADFYNPIENEGWYHLQFEIRLPTKSEIGYEVLYTSGLVEAGKHIQKITLNRALPAGTYDAIIHIQPYRVEDNSPTNDAVVKTELVAK